MQFEEVAVAVAVALARSCTVPRTRWRAMGWDTGNDATGMKAVGWEEEEVGVEGRKVRWMRWRQRWGFRPSRGRDGEDRVTSSMEDKKKWEKRIRRGGRGG